MSIVLRPKVSISHTSLRSAADHLIYVISRLSLGRWYTCPWCEFPVCVMAGISWEAES